MRIGFFALPLVLVTVVFALTPQEEALRLVRQGDYSKAHPLVTRLLREAPQPGSQNGVPYRAALYEILGTIEKALERYSEAQQAFEQGLKLCQQHSPELPELKVSLLVSLAETHLARGGFQQAHRELQRAFDTATAALPPDHLRLASVLDGFASLHVARGQLSRAEQFLRRALAILERRLGPAHPDTAVEALSLASILLSGQRRDEAVPLIEQSKFTLNQALGSNHPRTVFASYTLALAHLQSNPAQAETVLRASLSAWRQTQPERHTTTARLLNALAAARRAQGDLNGAIEINAQALDTLRDVVGPEHPEVVSVMYDRAALLRLAKRKKEAATLRAEADRIRLAHGYAEPGKHTIDINTLRGR